MAPQLLARPHRLLVGGNLKREKKEAAAASVCFIWWENNTFLSMTSCWEPVAPSYLTNPGQVSVAPPLSLGRGDQWAAPGTRPTMADKCWERPIREAVSFCLITRSPRNNSRLFFLFQTASNREASAAEMLYYTISEVFQRCVTPPPQGSALSKAGDEKWTPCSAGLRRIDSFFFQASRFSY